MTTHYFINNPGELCSLIDRGDVVKYIECLMTTKEMIDPKNLVEYYKNRIKLYSGTVEFEWAKYDILTDLNVIVNNLQAFENTKNELIVFIKYFANISMGFMSIYKRAILRILIHCEYNFDDYNLLIFCVKADSFDNIISKCAHYDTLFKYYQLPHFTKSQINMIIKQLLVLFPDYIRNYNGPGLIKNVPAYVLEFQKIMDHYKDSSDVMSDTSLNIDKSLAFDQRSF